MKSIVRNLITLGLRVLVLAAHIFLPPFLFLFLFFFHFLFFFYFLFFLSLFFSPPSPSPRFSSISSSSTFNYYTPTQDLRNVFAVHLRNCIEKKYLKLTIIKLQSLS